jgi:hypothetical protein
MKLPAASCIKKSDLVARPIDILESNTIYRTALAGNINAFYHAIQMADTIQRMESRMKEFETMFIKKVWAIALNHLILYKKVIF